MDVFGPEADLSPSMSLLGILNANPQDWGREEYAYFVICFIRFCALVKAFEGR
jgi:hypothetical protein